MNFNKFDSSKVNFQHELVIDHHVRGDYIDNNAHTKVHCKKCGLYANMYLKREVIKTENEMQVVYVDDDTKNAAVKKEFQEGSCDRKYKIRYFQLTN